MFSDGCESLLPNLEGTLQTAYYYTNNKWNYICGSTMTMATAHVICRENANTVALDFQYVPSNFGISNFSIFDYQFDCNGTEESLCDCPITNQSCPTSEIVQIQCDLPGILNYIKLYFSL